MLQTSNMHQQTLPSWNYDMKVQTIQDIACVISFQTSANTVQAYAPTFASGTVWPVALMSGCHTHN